MSFLSVHHPRIWDRLYTVLIPDTYTLDKSYLSRFGTISSGNKKIDSMMENNLTTVMIPIATILDYFTSGIEIQIPSREDMIQMHKDIELYLEEWKQHIKYDVNLELSSHKDLILSLEKLSKYIYAKAKPVEVIDNLFLHKKAGVLISPLQRLKEKQTPMQKQDYEGIASLVKSKTRTKARYD